jgi:hypothetical protein
LISNTQKKTGASFSRPDVFRNLNPNLFCQTAAISRRFMEEQSANFGDLQAGRLGLALSS